MDSVLRLSVLCSMPVKPLGGAYCRLRSECHMDPVLRESSTHSMRVKPDAEAHCPFTFRLPHGPGAQRMKHVLVTFEATD
ncbi:hypothetical protein MRX96_017369 [Rhipicephalus microplus]